MPMIETRVDTLEGTLGQFIVHTDVALRRLENEMQAFKDEMQAFKDEVNEDRKRMNREWGNLANKMGTLVEDIIVPNIRGIARRYFNCNEVEDFMIRRRKRNARHREKIREFDVIAIYEERVIVNETKSTPRMSYIDDFADLLGEFYDYFPEYMGKEVTPVFASLYIEDDVVEYLSEKGIYAMGMKDDTMALLNVDNVSES